MSFTLELAAAWARSPVKAARNRRRAMNSMNADVPCLSNSPTRVTDFPVVEPMEDVVDELEEEKETLAAISSDRSGVVRKLLLSPEDDTTRQDVTPIKSFARQRSRKIKVLPTLGEQVHFEDDTPIAIVTVVKSKKKTSHLPKPMRSAVVNERIDEAVRHADTGDEDEAIKIYEKAIRMAETEVNRLKGQLNKSLEKHPVTLESIQTRIQEDMLELVLLAGKMKTEIAHLYERQGDYDNSILSCTEARSIYRKQRKRQPRTITPNTEGIEPMPDDDRKQLDVKSCGASKGSNDSDRSIKWYVACPELENFTKSCNYLLDRLTKAKETYDDRKKMNEEIFMLRQEIAETADVNHRRELYSRALGMAKNAVAIESSTLGEMHPQVANALQLLAAITMEQQAEKPKSRDTAIQYLLQGLDINMTTLGNKHPRTAQDLLRMARIYQQPVVLGVSPDISRSRQDEDRSIQYFNQAADIFRGVKDGSKVVGSILNDIAVIYVARREYHKSLDLLHESLACYESAIEEDCSVSDDFSGSVGTICIDAVQVMRNMGECYMNLREFKKAIESFVHALETQREARQNHDSVSESDDLDSTGDEKSFLVHLMMMINDESIADTLRRLGKAFAAAEKYQEAFVVYREALHIHRTSVNDAMAIARLRGNPELPLKQDQLANTLFCIAEVYLATESYANAIKIYNESMQLRISSDGYRPESQRCNMVHCAMCLVGVANVHFKKNEYIDAHKMYNSALFFCEAQGIPFTHAIVAMIEQRRKLAEQKVAEDPNRAFEILRLEERAESERRRGEYDKAIATLSEAMTIRMACTEKLKQAGKDSSAEIAATVRLLHTFGHVFAEQGNKEKAKRAHRDAIRLFRKHAPSQPPSQPPQTDEAKPMALPISGV